MNPEGNGECKPEEQQPEQAATFNIKDLELEQTKREAGEYKDKYLRLLAEIDNTKKRLFKDQQDMVQTAVENVIIDFLSPIDHMENALSFSQQMSDEVKQWALGFKMILTQFKDALSNNGVTAINAEKAPFDPHLHEAIEMVATNDYPPGTIVEECVKGYKMGERIVRPARVKVAKVPAESPTNGLNEEENNE